MADSPGEAGSQPASLVFVLLLSVLAFLGGAVGGDLLHRRNGSAPETAPVAQAETPEKAAPDHAPGKASAGEPAATTAEADDWFSFPNQFFVPIMRNGSTTAVMVLSLTVEMSSAARPRIEAQEHRLRDALLGALMIRANTGGFDGNFTSEASMSGLRSALLEAAQDAAGPEISGILIGDIARQDQ